jgi:hypothetical protein
MMVKLARPGEGGTVGGARPPPFTISTITYKVVVYRYAPAERAGTLHRCLLYLYLYSVEETYSQRKFIYFLEKPIKLRKHVWGTAEDRGERNRENLRKKQWKNPELYRRRPVKLKKHVSEENVGEGDKIEIEEETYRKEAFLTAQETFWVKV